MIFKENSQSLKALSLDMNFQLLVDQTGKVCGAEVHSFLLAFALQNHPFTDLLVVNRQDLSLVLNDQKVSHLPLPHHVEVNHNHQIFIRLCLIQQFFQFQLNFPIGWKLKVSFWAALNSSAVSFSDEAGQFFFLEINELEEVLLSHCSLDGHEFSLDWFFELKGLSSRSEERSFVHFPEYLTGSVLQNESVLLGLHQKLELVRGEVDGLESQTNTN